MSTSTQQPTPPQEMADLDSITATDYMIRRLQHKIDDYSGKGNLYRHCYVTIACLTVACSAIVPVLINVKENATATLVATILSLLVTILVGVESVLHLREHWKNYDWAKVVLRREKYCYQTRTGDYAEEKNGDGKTRFALLVERVEDAMLEERRQTIEMRTAVASNPKQKKG